MTPAKQRAARIAQAKHRGTKASHKTELENLRLLFCWEAESLSEGQLSRLMNLDRVSLRQMRLDAIDAGMKLAEQLHKPAARLSQQEVGKPCR